MKLLRRIMLPLSLCAIFAASVCMAADTANATTFTQTKAPKIAVVNFKTCVEKSKLGKKEQSALDVMRKQMETILMEKEKALVDIENKRNDIDYLDSLSPEAESELKNKLRTLSQEYSQQKQQFYQVYSQTNMNVLQKLTDAITKAAQDVAKKNQIDIVLNEETSFYIAPALDVSQNVIQLMDESYEKEGKDTKATATMPESIK